MQGTAAALLGPCDHVVARAAASAVDGGLLDAREGLAHDAAAQHDGGRAARRAVAPRLTAAWASSALPLRPGSARAANRGEWPAGAHRRATSSARPPHERGAARAPVPTASAPPPSRAISSISPYCTPDGQAVSQARQPRQRSSGPRRVLDRELAGDQALHDVDPAARAVGLGREQVERRAVTAGRARTRRTGARARRSAARRVSARSSAVTTPHRRCDHRRHELGARGRAPGGSGASRVAGVRRARARGAGRRRRPTGPRARAGSCGRRATPCARRSAATRGRRRAIPHRRARRARHPPRVRSVRCARRRARLVGAAVFGDGEQVGQPTSGPRRRRRAKSRRARTHRLRGRACARAAPAGVPAERRPTRTGALPSSMRRRS